MSELYEQLNRHILPLVTRPSRYTGSEPGAVIKDPSKVKLSFLLAFPDTYEIGMSHLGLRVLYEILNRRDDIACERTFAPWVDMEERMRESTVPLFSLENHVPAGRFDVIGFSLQYELLYTNVINMLDLAGVPIRTSDRGPSDPYVIGGGSCSFNPEPVAAFFDAIVIGDGEKVVLELADCLMDARESGCSRQETLRSLASLEGVYVPSLYEARYRDGVLAGIEPKEDIAPATVGRRLEKRLELDGLPREHLVALGPITHDRLSVEIMRGCTRGCRFCQAGMISRPVRQRFSPDVLEASVHGIDSTGYEEVSLLSLSTSDYEGLPGLVDALNSRLFDKRVNVSLPSLRPDSFSFGLAKGVSVVRKSGLTFAAEAGTQGLRNVINKGIDEDAVLTTIGDAFQAGWRKVKLYFMIGLPTETDEDLDGIVRLVRKVRSIAKAAGKRTSVSVSLSPFVPRPHTPFQWEKQVDVAELNRRGRYVSSRLKGRAMKVNWRDPEVSLLECALARGDRRIADVIEEAWRSGARLDGWSEHFDMGKWYEAFLNRGVGLEDLAGEIPVDRCLPWDHIDPGVSKRFLLQEREKAYRGELTPDCREGHCYGCGVDPDICAGARLDERKAVALDGEQSAATGEDRFGRQARRDRRGAAKTKPQRRVRFVYSKMGRARFLSHLDVIRIIGRAIRAASIPVAYSRGHNPHQELSFGPPLPLGMTSRCEFVDMTLSGDTDVDIVASLNSVLPEGIEVISADWVQSGTKSLMKTISMASYLITLWPDRLLDRGSLSRMIEVGLKSLPEDVRERISRVEAVGDSKLEMDLIAGEKGHPRPDRIVPELLKDLKLEINQLDYERIAQYMFENGRLVDLLTNESYPTVAERRRG